MTTEKISLDSCTKSELIYLIKQRALLNTDNIEFDVLMCRSAEATKKEREEHEKANEALHRYISLMNPYNGVPIMDIPADVIDKAAKEMEICEASTKRGNSYNKQYNKIQKQLDAYLE